MKESEWNPSSNLVFDFMPSESPSPAEQWAEEAAKHALDDLFNATFAYRSSKQYYQMMQFVRKFRFYSPYNALLIHIQRPGAQFVAPANRWNRKYRRNIKPNANPLVILQPMGPVMFVFDVSDTEARPDSIPLPKEVEAPFEVQQGKIGQELECTIENSKRDGIRIQGCKAGSQHAGCIRLVKDGLTRPPLKFRIRKDGQGNPVYEQIPVRYELLVNEGLNREALYATVVHELAHVYCGHLGTPDPRWWPDRRGFPQVAAEFEAESVSYLACGRLGIASPSAEYLANYVKTREDLPQISLECVMKTAGLIESMGRGRLKPRKKNGQ